MTCNRHSLSTIQNATIPRAAVLLHFALCILSCQARAHAQEPAPAITEIRVEQEGVLVTNRLITDLIETAVGEPLSMRDVRETITHLTNLGRFDDVQVFREPAASGIRLRYVLFPVHTVDRVELRGALGLSEGDLRQLLSERFGAAPPAGRTDDVVRTLTAFYRDRGYVEARIVPRIEPTHNPDRATMLIEIEAGSRATIQHVDVERVPTEERAAVLAALGARIGQPYDAPAIQRRLEEYENTLRSRGYYEARAQHDVRYPSPAQADVTVTVDQGPLVSVTFAGDSLPEAERERLVPVRSEGSVDEDLLEDATRAIEEYLFARGYRDATATYARRPDDGRLTLVFTVSRGPRYITEGVEAAGNTAIATPELLEILRVKPGEPFVQGAVDAGAGSVRQVYRGRGFTRALVQPSVSTVARPADGSSGGDRYVLVRLNIVEGPRTLVGSLAIEGNNVVSEGELRTEMISAPGRPYSEFEIASDRDRIDLEYRNRGYENVVVDPRVAMSSDGSRADVRFVVSEGPQVIVDRIMIVGNTRTGTSTISRELLLRPGEPLGYSALLESRQRLSALGLFRNVRISELTHTGESRRDILVEIEEAPPTTLGYGGGIEGGTRLRPTGVAGQAEERFEMAPRGFFEIGRRNLWGKNRSVNLFTRVSLRSRDVVLSDSGVRLERPAEEGGYGFNEYRILGNYREPHIFDTRADVLVTAVLDQAIRSSFNFRKRELRGEAGVRLSTRYSVAGRYSFEHTRLFDERFTDEEKPLIDRIFPQVRLSKFSASFIRDTRDDVLDPNRGNFLIVDSEVAARAFGSEVGFYKEYVQGFLYHRLPVRRRTIVGLGARVGAAHGFRRVVVRSGSPVAEVQDLPASERFFAGGDTTVRGFSLDRLGTAETISPAGFPTGGNGLIVLNAELRVALVRRLTGVGFVDAGNVFARATSIDLTDLRRSAGFGVVYGSPVGPIRINLGFKLDRRELSPGRLERRSVLHISLGQAF